MPAGNLPFKSYLTDLIISVGAGVMVYYLTNQLIKTLDFSNGPTGLKSKETKKKISATLDVLKSQKPDQYKNLQLNDYELFLLDSLIIPQSIDVSFNDVGGLEEIIDDLRESILYPLTHPELFPENSILVQAPKGVLLYGPPGCGKTMLAKALAKESGANFLSIRMSLIMDKWYGESNKIVDAIFSLAKKLQPCIIFIDEIDSFLRRRESNDHEITSSIKSEFMILWDGLVNSGRILVLGATNRPNDIDEAFLRRMPKKFQINKPGGFQRMKILEKLLEGSNLDDNFDLAKLVDVTEDFSGSDLKELCRDATMNVAREYIKNNFKDGKPVNNDVKITLRPLKTSDFYINEFKNKTSQMNVYGDGRSTGSILDTVQ
ncbi:Msp1 protein [Saccharomycopsis crataegensis]|uniref:Msp1 protein n=1 Tax=Saccharomycopsis crataegensis TaxID=43959 RepID=A0AAV5QQF5_9ASCO|nr:Msp1 protein [Saccharomycopsis crataegensis]